MTIPPAPFIVGVPRSGTTLLRLMLDAHPQLAIPPETHFIPELVESCVLAENPAHTFFTSLEQHFSWPDYHLEIEAIRARLGNSFDVGNAIRTFFLTYAGKFGKVRWGDKTPTYLTQMTAIEAVLPESRFIHIIRDGRDVSLSIADLWFGPHSGHKTAGEVARWWAARVNEGRREGSKARHYMELRFEDLVTEPEPVLRRIAEFIDLPWDPSMLDYHSTARQRIAELQSTRFSGGKGITPEARRQIHAHTELPPSQGRAERWRTEMPLRDQQEFLEAAGELLDELGYGRAGSTGAADKIPRH